MNCGQAFVPDTPPPPIWRVSSYLLVDSALSTDGACQIVHRHAGTKEELRRRVAVE